MGKNVEHIQHIKSNVVFENGKPKLPQPGTLVEGELAVNYAKDVETISLENASGEVVTFSSDKYYTEQKLGSAFTGANSAVTVTDVIEENEEIISSALNDLEVRKLDTSAYTPSIELWESGTGLNSVVLKGSSGTAIGDYSVAEGWKTLASGYSSHAEGWGTVASGDYSHTEGMSTSATSFQTHAEGMSTLASGGQSHAEGTNTKASGYSSHAEGQNTKAIGDQSHAEGDSTTATSYQSHAEGSSTLASGGQSHAEGTYTKASGSYSHAEGNGTKASGSSSHAEGSQTVASGDRSHAEGESTSATSNSSHAEGYKTLASGKNAHAEGRYTIANNQSEHASGQWNVSNSATTEFGNSGNTLFSVGNGTADDARHNAFEIMQNGDIYIVDNNGNNIKLQDNLGGGSGIVDQVLDDTTSASTNAVSSKAVYKAVTDNELVWTNAFVTLSSFTSAHTEDVSVHVTAADRNKLNSITGTFGTMAYEDANSYSSATQVSTALQEKSNTNHDQAANTITAMTGYLTSSTVSDISTSDTLNQAVAKLEARFDGIRLLKISQTDYDNLQTKDPNTLYVITD